MLNFLKEHKKKINKKFFIFLIATFIVTCGIVSELFKGTSATDTISDVPANPAFDDINFYKCVVDAYNSKNKTDVSYTTDLSDDELATITYLNCFNGYGVSDEEKISNLSGLEKLVNVEALRLERNNITSIDLSNNSKLKELFLAGNSLTSLDLSNNPNLEMLDIGYWCHLDSSSYGSCSAGNSLTSLDLSHNSLLEKLYVANSPIETLNLDNSINLSTLFIYGTFLEGLDLTSNELLVDLNLENTNIVNLDLSNNTKLEKININKSKIESINLGLNDNLEKLYLTDNNILSLDLSGLSSLSRCEIYGNELSSLDLRNNSMLTVLDVSNNNLTELDLTNNLELIRLEANRNKLTDLNVNNLSKLEYLSVYLNYLTNIDVSSNIALTDLHIGTTNYEFSKGDGEIVNENYLTSLDVSKNVLLETLVVDRNNLTELNISSLKSLTYLDVGNNQLTELDASNNILLKQLCIENNKLTNLIVSNNPKLEYLFAPNNRIDNLDLSNSTLLKTITLDDNQLTELDVSGALALEKLSVYANQLTALDVSHNSQLTELFASSNQLINLDVSKSIKLTQLGVSNNQLIELDVSKNTLLKGLYAENNKLSKLDVTNNLNLKDFKVYGNRLTSLDLSNNTKLTSGFVTLGGNLFAENLYVYKNNKIKVGNVLKLPENLDWKKKSWTSGDTSIVTVDTGVVTAVNVGVTDVISRDGDAYKITSTINVIEITSSKYEINEENGYIAIGSDSDVNMIKSNIKVSDEDVDLNVDMENYKLQVKHGDEALKEFDIVGFSSSKYDLSKEYIYVGLNELNLDEITTVNCEATIDNGKLLIKKDDIVVGEYLLVSMSSSKYDLSKDYVYVGVEKLNNDDIIVVNGTSVVSEDKLLIKYGDDIVRELDLINVSSDIYDLSNDYIYVGTNDINTINITTKGDLVLENNKLLIKYNNDLLDEFVILGIEINNYNVVRNYITNIDEVSYNEFISNINVDTGVSYKLFNGEEEVTSGNVTVEMKLKIYYGDKEIYEYKLVNDYLDVGLDYIVDESNSIVSNVLPGTTNEELLENVNTNGEVSIFDKDDNLMDSFGNLKTGYKFIVTFPNNYSLTYKISVNGDVNGDGVMNRDDIELSSKHIIKGNLIIGAEYLKSLDFDNDEKTNINDIIKMFRYIKDSGDINE